MSENNEQRLRNIEAMLIELSGKVNILSGKNEAYERFQRDMMSNLDEDNVPGLRYKVSKGDMTAAFEVAAEETEALVTAVARFTGSAGVISAASIPSDADKSKIYLNTTDNKYYAWNGTAWAEIAKPTSEAVASLQIQANSYGSSIGMIASSTGNAGVIVVATWSATGKDTSKTYYAENTKYYYTYNGSAWTAKTSASAAASFMLSAINGQSAANISADRIGLTADTVVFATQAGLAAGTVVVHGGCLGADTVQTDALKVRTESNLKWLDFYAGIDMTVIDVTAASYYPDTRQLKGVKAIRFHKDTSLTSGHGGSGNTLSEIGALQINTTGIGSLGTSWSAGLSLFLLDTTNTDRALELASSGAVAINSGYASTNNGGVIMLTAYATSVKTSGYVLQLTQYGLALYKFVSGTSSLIQSWA